MSAEALTAAASAPGFYGKLPLRGDFIGRRLGRKFVDAWDDWLRDAIHASRTMLGDRWLDLYLNSPIWRFALGARTCGPYPVAGVMIPSVDSVGRYFPLMIGCELSADADIATLIEQSSGWYDAIEQRILSTLEPGFSLDTLDMSLTAELPIPPRFNKGSDLAMAPGLHFPSLSGAAADQVRRSRGDVTIWWTDGSDVISPCCIVSAGLPTAPSFASLLDGDWEARGWVMRDRVSQAASNALDLGFGDPETPPEEDY